MSEYELRMEAFSLRNAYEQKLMAQVAFFNQKQKAVKGRGNNQRLVYDNFDKLYNYEKAIDEVRSSFENDYKSQKVMDKEKQEADAILRRMKEFRKLKAEGKIIPWNERQEKDKKY